jgi:hypothetical protein
VTKTIPPSKRLAINLTPKSLHPGTYSLRDVISASSFSNRGSFRRGSQSGSRSQRAGVNSARRLRQGVQLGKSQVRLIAPRVDRSQRRGGPSTASVEMGKISAACFASAIASCLRPRRASTTARLLIASSLSGVAAILRPNSSPHPQETGQPVRGLSLQSSDQDRVKNARNRRRPGPDRGIDVPVQLSQ